MIKVAKLEQEIQELDTRDLVNFREWFYKFDSEKWDIQIEEDIQSGKIDKIAEKSITAHQEGRSKKL